MDIVFHCPKCNQELEVESSGAGSKIDCPACQTKIDIPEATPENIRLGHSTTADSASAKEKHHFSVPVHDAPTEILVKNVVKKDDFLRKGQDARLRIKSIRRSECIEVGLDRFDDVVSEFLGKVGEENINTISTVSYSFIDIGSQKILVDYGVIVVYKG